MSESLQFPDAFVWGVSTSAHQFEGGLDDNNWGAWERRGKIKTGERSGRACDWWHNAERDFDLARSLGLSALRLSVEWSRIEPREGEWDERALGRYRAMLMALRDRGIQPWVCLHHFTNPLWFEARGGFEDPDSVRLFERFARRVGTALGDLCTQWVTLNEPNVYAVQGWLFGEFPPGRTGDLRAVTRVLKHLGLAHARAYAALHAVVPGAQVGFTQNCFAFAPAHPRSPLDRGLAALNETLFVDAFLDAALSGRVPAVARPFAPAPSDMRGTLDFVGLNIYGRLYFAFDPLAPKSMFGRRSVPASVPQGDRGAESPYGECWPGAVSRFVRRFANHGLPVWVLENGVPDRDDRVRPWMIAHVARELHGLVRDGIDVRGYFHWSLVDNFEWAEGWGLRFGLCAMDPATQARTLRASGRLYGAIATHNALRPEDVATFAPSAYAEIFG